MSTVLGTVVSQAFPAKSMISAGRVLAGAERDHRLDGLAQRSYGNADDRDIGHGRVLGHELFDLG